jgi:hypothetical protein
MFVDNEALRSFFIFEAKLSMFLRIAQSRDGAEKLIDGGIVEAVTDCSFIDERPERHTSSEGMPRPSKGLSLKPTKLIILQTRF